jgi:hypothetical protein
MRPALSGILIRQTLGCYSQSMTYPSIIRLAIVCCYKLQLVCNVKLIIYLELLARCAYVGLTPKRP